MKQLHQFEEAATMEAKVEATFFTSLENKNVDAEEGIIRDVAVITSGVTAKGHKLQTDAKTLRQMKELGQRMKQVPVKWNHRTGADAVNGYLQNFRIKGSKLVADWHLLKSHKQYDHAIELATRMPGGVGLSASFLGLSELEDGTKVFNPDKKTRTHFTLKGRKRCPVSPADKIFARCDDLLSVDLVSNPAANPTGLFEARVDTSEEDMAKTATKPGGATEPASEEQEFSSADIMAAIEGLQKSNEERFDAFEQRFEALEAEPEPEPEPEAEEETRFESLEDVANYFEGRINEMQEAQEREEFEAAYGALEERIEKLTELNAQLVGESEVMAEAIQRFSEEEGGEVEFQAGTDTENPVIHLHRKEKGEDGRELTEFEARVQELQTGDDALDAKAAMLKAVEEDGPRYRAHLQAKGAFTHEMAG